VGEVIGRQRERRAVHGRVPRQQRTAIHRHLQPLVRIERHRIGARERLEAAGVGRVERRPGAECAVDVQPDVVPGGDVRDLVERVDGAGVRCAAAGNDRERQVTCAAVVLDRAAERVGPHAELLVRRDRAQLLCPDAELFHALLDRGMALLARVEDELRMAALQAFRAHVPAGAGSRAMARGGQGVQRRRGAAGQQQALAAFDRKTDELHDPAADAHHQEDSRTVVAVEAGIHRVGDRVGEERDGRRRRIDPCVRALMTDRDGPGHDLVLQEIQDFLGRSSLLRQRLAHQAAAHLRRHDAVDRLDGKVSQVLADHRGGARAEPIEILAVFGKGMHGRLGHCRSCPANGDAPY
jgi:hypothetical protein